MKTLRNRNRAVPGAILLLALMVGATAAAADTRRCDPQPPTQIDLAICLDTSGSMSGLIESAKLKLWAIVNDLACIEPAPELRVALLTFGNDGNSARTGWVAVETPFTHDLDLVSRRLFCLGTNGGTEYVGRVLDRASDLAWSRNRRTLQIAVVAGNESADQDRRTPYWEVCRDLAERGIIVNAIYCGPPHDDIAPGWREVARLGGGQFSAIDHDRGTVIISSPYDDRLGELGTALNRTYVPFGKEGRFGAANQAEQDANASALNPASGAARAATKASPFYKQSWDLVDAVENEEVTLDEVPREDLPEAMRELDAGEQAAYLAEMQVERQELKEQIADLTAQRETFVAEEMKRQALDETKALDFAIRQAIREQAAAKGFVFKSRDGKETGGQNGPGSD